MDSGIEVDEELKQEYNLMKQNKLPEPVALLVMEMSDDNKKVVKAPALCLTSCTHLELIDFFGDEARKERCYCVVFDFDHKLVLIKWAPDNAPMKQKMMYASTYSAIKGAFEGIKYCLQAVDVDDLKEAEVFKKA